MFFVFMRIFRCTIPVSCLSSLSSLWSIFDEHKVIFCYLVQAKLSLSSYFILPGKKYVDSPVAENNYEISNLFFLR